MNNLKNKKVLILIAISIVLIVLGIALLLFGNNGKENNNDNEKENTDKPIEKKILRKITEEELNNDSAKEIIQFYMDEKYPEEKWEVEKARLVATNLLGKYLIDFDALKNNDRYYLETAFVYLDNGEWFVDLPAWDPKDPDAEFTVFYAEGE